MDDNNFEEICLSEKVNQVFVDEKILNKVSEEIGQSLHFDRTKEFREESCTYNDPPPEAKYIAAFSIRHQNVVDDDPFENTNCDSHGGWAPDFCEEPVGEPLPDGWLDSLNSVEKDTVLGVPRTKQEFLALRRALISLGRNDSHKPLKHPEFPKYTKDLEMKWRDLLKVEERRKVVALCQQVWQDMWENYPDIMRETIPDYIPKEEELKGLVVMYVNVGNLAPHEAEKHIDKVKASCKQLKNIPLDYGIMWLPVRGNEQNKVELIKF